MGFWRALLSVNQGFSGQNLGHYLGQFLSSMERSTTRSMAKSRWRNQTAGRPHHSCSDLIFYLMIWRNARNHASLLTQKSPNEGAFMVKEKNYFFLQSAWFSFSFLEQSTFLSSIFPPPWLPAKAGTDTNINTKATIETSNFIKTPWFKKLFEVCNKSTAQFIILGYAVPCNHRH